MVDTTLGLNGTPTILLGDTLGKSATATFDGITIDFAETKVLPGDGTGTSLYFNGTDYFSFDNLVGLP